jgi:hypothetical protein
MVKAEAVRIEDSPPAPLFTVIVGPSVESREVGKTRRTFVAEHEQRRRFWTALLALMQSRTQLFGSSSANDSAFLTIDAGVPGLTYTFALYPGRVRVELYLDRGKGHEAENQAIFAALQSQQAQIELAFGEPLEWDVLRERQARRIAYCFRGAYLPDEERWPEIQARMIDAMIRLEAALRPHLAALPV